MKRIKDVLKQENVTRTKGSEIDYVETRGDPYKEGFVVFVRFKDGHYLMATDPAVVSTGMKEPEPEPEVEPEKPTRRSRSR